MFEIALFEWHVTPEYILRMWTEEKLQVLLEGRRRRLAAEKTKTTGDGVVSDNELFKQMGYTS